MYIKELLNYDEEAHEADIVISDGQFDLLCYAHPFISGEYKELKAPLSAFMSENIMRTSENEYRIERLQDNYYAHRFHGKIIDLQKRLVTIGNIVIKLENTIPKDINEGEFIEFSAMRIDL